MPCHLSRRFAQERKERDRKERERRGIERVVELGRERVRERVRERRVKERDQVGRGCLEYGRPDMSGNARIQRRLETLDPRYTASVFCGLPTRL